MSAPENPPAFPTNPHNHGYGDAQGTGSQSGMTLRDYFAAHALAGFVVGRKEYTETFAEEAYKTADAMLKQRKEKP